MDGKMSKSVVLQIARTEKCGWEEAKGFRPGVSQGVCGGRGATSTRPRCQRCSSYSADQLRPPKQRADGRPAGNIPRNRVSWSPAGRSR